MDFTLNKMIEQKYTDIVTDKLLVGTLDHDAYDGFLQDYRVLSCLLRIYKPKSVFEIGTNIGSGICVIHAAIPNAKIFSLDLDYETMRLNSLQYPLEADGTDRVGSAAKAAQIDYTQLRGDSLKFNYSKYPCEAYYIDGEHTEKNALNETEKILDLSPKLIIWHDTDMPEVMSGIIKAFDNHVLSINYYLYRVIDTRISYAVRKMEKS